MTQILPHIDCGVHCLSKKKKKKKKNRYRHTLPHKERNTLSHNNSFVLTVSYIEYGTCGCTQNVISTHGDTKNVTYTHGHKKNVTFIHSHKKNIAKTHAATQRI